VKLKTLIFIFGFVFASLGCAQNVLSSNNVSQAAAIKVVSQFHVGMWEEEVSKILETNGIKYAIGVGAAVGWGRFYGLSDGTSLHLDYSARFIPTNRIWGGNGILNKATIRSNNVDIVSIPLKPAPKRADL
jgi:hypothetical protein